MTIAELWDFVSKCWGLDTKPVKIKEGSAYYDLQSLELTKEGLIIHVEPIRHEHVFDSAVGHAGQTLWCNCGHSENFNVLRAKEKEEFNKQIAIVHYTTDIRPPFTL